MKRFITDAAVVAIGLAGLVLSHVVVSPASVAVPVSVSDADKAAALHATGADYANSLFRGDSLNVMGHLSDFCSDSEQGEAGYATELIVRKAKGATLTVTSVTDRKSVV